MRNFLHVGCGGNRKEQTTPGFNSVEWNELRFDIDASVKPDLLGTMTDMRAVADESVDAIFSSHNIEHLYPYEVPLALKEFLRVLKPDGFVVITCPDLQTVCSFVANNQLTQSLYESPVGPISAMDILYGHQSSLSKGNVYMAHRCGFTRDVLSQALNNAGFCDIIAIARPQYLDLWAVATKSPTDMMQLKEFVFDHDILQPS